MSIGLFAYFETSMLSAEAVFVQTVPVCPTTKFAIDFGTTTTPSLSFNRRLFTTSQRDKTLIPCSHTPNLLSKLFTRWVEPSFFLYACISQIYSISIEAMEKIQNNLNRKRRIRCGGFFHPCTPRSRIRSKVPWVHSLGSHRKWRDVWCCLRWLLDCVMWMVQLCTYTCHLRLWNASSITGGGNVKLSFARPRTSVRAHLVAVRATLFP